MSWYIIVTNPNCYRRAEAGLAAIGYRSFWPKYRKWASHARTRVAKEYPVLGRYLFVEVPDANFWAVRAVHGVEGFITDERNAPAVVSERIVWDFRERYMRGEWDFVTPDIGEFPDPERHGQIVLRRNPIPIGARVRIMEGEFADLLTVIRGRRNGKLQFLPPGKREFFQTRENNVRAA